MTDPARLLDEGATESELAILRAGAFEEPPAHGPRRLAAAMGLSGSAATAAAQAAGSSLNALLTGSTAKWLIVSSVALGGGAFVYVRHERARETASRPAERVPAEATLPTAGAEPSSPDVPGLAQPAGGSTDIPPPAARPRDRAPVKSTQSSGAAESGARSSSKSIGAEIEELDGVRRSLRAGAPLEALAALDHYDREHAGGALTQEAALLRIEALSASGDTAGARRLAERFLRNNPRSPHKRRITALVGDVP